MKITRVGIAAKIGSQEASKVALDAGKFLSSRGVEVLYAPEVDCHNQKKVPLEEMPADMIVVVGGDGTVMRTAQKIGSTPLLGIKVGALGFLCEATPETLSDALERVVSDRFYLEYKTKFRVSYTGMDLPTALNEVLVTTAKPSKILRISVSKDGETLHRGRADGVIVSTTTGSTAYALSAGGPIVDPHLDVMEVIFICQILAGIRPMLFPSSSCIEVKVLPGAASALLALDGQTILPLEFEEPVTVRKAVEPAAFVRVGPPDYYRRIREKVKLGLEV